MLKVELVQRVADLNPDLSRATCRKIVDAFFDGMTDHLAQHGRIELRGFGGFFVAVRYIGGKHDPRTGEPTDATPQPRIRFRPYPSLSEAFALR
jgi:integration host factor subunit beta